MIQKTARLIIPLAVLLGAAAQAEAQTPPASSRWSAEVNIGTTTQTETFTETTTPLIYGENAVITVPHTIGRGPLFDAAVGFHIWENLGVGVGYSYFSRTETTTVSAQVPNPAIFDSPRSAAGPTGPLSHSESVVHVKIMWTMPINDRFDVTAILGPSFFTVRQDLVSGLNLTEGPPLFDTVTINSVTTQSQSKTAVALTVGGDASYYFSPKVGAGLFVRYSHLSGGNADVPTPDGSSTVSVPAGGVQVGVGLRVRF